MVIADKYNQSYLYKTQRGRDILGEKVKRSVSTEGEWQFYGRKRRKENHYMKS